MLTARQKLGLQGEAIAATWLEQKGWHILARRFRTGHRDVDLIASWYDPQTREQTVAFIEVRTRQSTQYGHPIETVQRPKQLELRKAARVWLSKNKRPKTAYRFDLIGIVLTTPTPEIVHVPNAF